VLLRQHYNHPEQIVKYAPGGSVGKGESPEDDSHEHPEINPVDAHLMLQTLETFWLQQDEVSQEFIRSLQQMKNKIYEIRVNQMVQMDIRKFFNHL
jgi:hypothetical protein